MQQSASINTIFTNLWCSAAGWSMFGNSGAHFVPLVSLLRASREITWPHTSRTGGLFSELCWRRIGQANTEWKWQSEPRSISICTQPHTAVNATRLARLAHNVNSVTEVTRSYTTISVSNRIMSTLTKWFPSDWLTTNMFTRQLFNRCFIITSLRSPI